MIAVMCIMMEVVLIMMEVICITCGMMEFGLHCCVAQALAGIEGRGYHNSNAAVSQSTQMQPALGHAPGGVFARGDCSLCPSRACERTFPENSSRTHAAACFD